MKTPLRPGALLTAAVVSLLMAACTGLEPEPLPDVGFVADPAPDAAGLALSGVFDEELGELALEVRGHQLGPVLGWAAHVVWDGEHLSADASATEIHLEALGDDVTVQNVLHTGNGRARMGAARIDAALTDAEVSDDVLLARLTLRAEVAAVSDVKLERAMVRRADASHVALLLAGGRLTTAE